MKKLKSNRSQEKNLLKDTNKEYIDVLINKYFIRHKMKRIQSKLHRIGTYDACKTSLSYFDDRRNIFDDGINGLAYFHKDVKSQ